jgi:peptidoglycan/xylan/chitin deacetylase (PgdA/CDA1 family)
VAVLAFHRIADVPATNPLSTYAVTPSQFVAQLDALRGWGFEFVSAARLLEALRGESRMPKRGVLVTFDDCYVDLATTAAPILEARGIPAVAFAVAGKWGGTNDWEAPDAAGDGTPLLSASALRDLSSCGVELGAHSLTHARLPELEARSLDDEIFGARYEFRRAGLPEPRLFSYPYGLYSDECVRRVQVAGYAAAFTTRSGVVTQRSGMSPYLLPRIDLRLGDMGGRFGLRLASAWLRTVLRHEIPQSV